MQQETNLVERLKTILTNTVAEHIYLTYGDLEVPDNPSVLSEEWVKVRNIFVTYSHCRDWSGFNYTHGVDLWKELNQSNDTKSFLEILYRIMGRWSFECGAGCVDVVAKMLSEAVSAYWRPTEQVASAMDDGATSHVIMEERFTRELTSKTVLCDLLSANPWLQPLVFFSLFGGEIIHGVEQRLFGKD